MVDLRLYRLAFLPALGALAVLMFSLAGAPEGLRPALPPAAFDEDGASSVTRQIATRIPDREPGGAGDAEAAALVAERFGEIPSGIVTEQAVSSTWDGDEVELRNVVLTLPGDRPGAVAIVAARPSPRGPGAASSAAATAVLVELAAALGVTGHDRTYLLASTGAGPASGAGVRAALEAVPDNDSIAAVIVISQPGARLPRQPLVVASAAAAARAPVQLVRTAALAVEAQTEIEPSQPSWPEQLARFAIPAGLGPQAELIAAGIDAITISSAGERPLPPAEDGLDDLDPATVAAFGRAVQATVAALDLSPAGLDSETDPHLQVGDNLVPGWALTLLAIALLMPAAVAAIDAAARAVRRRAGLRRGLGWTASFGLPPIGALAALYALALLGAIPRPGFPFDPGLHPLGLRAVIALAAVAAAAAASAFALRRARRGRTRPRAAAAIPASGLVAVAAVAAAWLANPFLGLLLTPCAHVWMLAGRGRRGGGGGADAGAGAPGASRWRRGTVTGLAALASLVPFAAALAALGAALDLGFDLPWFLTLLIADGQLGLVTVLAVSFLCASLAAVVSVAMSGHQVPVGAHVRRPPANPASRSSRSNPASRSSRASRANPASR